MKLESKPIALFLDPAVFALVLRGLGKLPYEESSGIIHALQQEAFKQQQPAPPPPPPEEPAARTPPRRTRRAKRAPAEAAKE